MWVCALVTRRRHGGASALFGEQSIVLWAAPGLWAIAQFLSIPLDFDHGYPTALGGNQGAANAIKAAALKQGVVLVAWEHYNIQILTADLGVDKKKIPY